MTQDQFKYSDKLTEAQRDAMRNLHKRSGIAWPEFLERCQLPAGMFPYVSVHNFHGMFVGIEPDGYTHS